MVINGLGETVGISASKDELWLLSPHAPGPFWLDFKRLCMRADEQFIFYITKEGLARSLEHIVKCHPDARQAIFEGGEAPPEERVQRLTHVATEIMHFLFDQPVFEEPPVIIPPPTQASS